MIDVATDQKNFDFAARREYLTRLEEEFHKFHVEHPAVYRKFTALAFKLIERGKSHYSADAIIQVIRFETDLGWGADGFKINDHHTAFYSRLFTKDHPEYKDFFRKRKTSHGG